MTDFNGSLLREKIIIRDLSQVEEGEPPSSGSALVSTSNRMVVNLLTPQGEIRETFVVRAQNMHTCIRLASRIVNAYSRSGPILSRDPPFDWQQQWDAVYNDYEKKFNPPLWASIYNKGKLLFEFGNRHPLIDIIEQMDAKNANQYDNSVQQAKEALRQAGRNVAIDHDANIGMVINVEGDHARVGIMLRSTTRTTTFNFRASSKAERKVAAAQCLSVAAAFLEGIQLAFIVGMLNEQVKDGSVRRTSFEGKKADAGRQRLGVLGTEIRSFESALEVRFRPERPEFGQLVEDAERYFEKALFDSRIAAMTAKDKEQQKKKPDNRDR